MHLHDSRLCVFPNYTHFLFSIFVPCISIMYLPKFSRVLAALDRMDCFLLVSVIVVVSVAKVGVVCVCMCVCAQKEKKTSRKKSLCVGHSMYTCAKRHGLPIRFKNKASIQGTEKKMTREKVKESATTRQCYCCSVTNFNSAHEFLLPFNVSDGFSL